MLVFSQKSVAPGFIKNTALLLDNVLRVGICSNPRNDLLQVFGLYEMPAIVLVYHTWSSHIQGAEGHGEKALGQTVYNKEQFGKPNFVNLIRYIMDFGRAADFSGFLDDMELRIKSGMVAVEGDEQVSELSERALMKTQAMNPAK